MVDRDQWQAMTRRLAAVGKPEGWLSLWYNLTWTLIGALLLGALG